MKTKNNSCNKLIAVLIVFVIMISEIILIPTNAYAAIDDLEKQGNNTNNRNVNFDVYFGENQERKHSVEIVDESVAKLKIEINVGAGYLTNMQISINEPNFGMQTIQNEMIKSIENNTINLSDINDATTLEIPLTMQKNDNLRLDYLDKETTVNMKAIYINDSGKNIEVKKELKIRLKWNLNTDFELTSNITNVLPFGERTLIQQKINIKEIERKSPIEQTKLSITAPKVNNVLPSEVRVFANSTKGTNGDEFGKNFGTNNYKYDQNTGNIEIAVNNNVNENQEIAFYDALDEYILTYIYDQNTNELLKNKLQVTTYVKADMKLYSKVDVISKENKNNYEFTEQVGDNITADIFTTDTINKGFLYDNYNETGYNLNYRLNINNKDTNNSINIMTMEPSFVTDRYEILTNKIYYKSLAVKEELFKKVLGTEGYINVYDSKSNLIATINKNTAKNSNGELEVIYQNAQTNIRIEISKPQVEGVLELRNYKVIDAKLNYNINQTKEFYAIKEKINITKQYENLLNLNETYTKIDLQMDNTELMPFVDNNVNLTLSLVTNSNKYDLFKNPEIRINLPEEIESINAGEISLVYNEELKFEYARLEENGRVLALKLTGEETNYKLGIQEGTKIIIPAVIRLKDTVPSKTSSIKLNYSNDLAKATEYSLQGKDSMEVPFNIVAKSGLITISELSGYAENETKRTMDENVVMGQLPIESNEKNAQINTILVNNYQSDMSNVRILGRIPFENNKKINGEDLGSSFNTTLTEALKTNGVNGKIYYSEESEPTEDSSSWQENISNFENIKSYKIVLDSNIGVGTKLDFMYNIKIPSNLQPNLKTYATYTVKYNINNQELESTQTLGLETPNISNNIITDNNNVKAENSINMQITPKLGDTILKDNMEIHEQEVINFKVDVTNNSSSAIENISIEMPIPENLVYLEKNETPYSDPDGDSTAGNYIGVYTEKPEKKTVQLVIDKLEVNETQTIEYELRVKNLADNEETKTVETNFILKINGIEQSTQKLTNIIKKAKIKTELSFMKRTYMVDRNEYTYSFIINNITDEDINDLTTTIQIPKEILVTEPKVISNGLGTDDENNTTIEVNDNNLLTFNMKTLKSGQQAEFEFLAKVTTLDIIDSSIDIFANTFVDNETYKSNIAKNKIEAAEVTIEKSSPTENQEVKAGDQITYNIKVTNKSDKIYSQIYIVDTLPKEIIADTLEYNRYINGTGSNTDFIEINENYDLSKTLDQEGDSSTTNTSEGRPNYDEEKNELTIPTMLPPSGVINIKITATVQDIEQDTTLTNVSRVYGEYVKSTTSNEVKHYAKGDGSGTTDPDDPNNPEDPSNTYSISGSIWLDSNENGALDSAEQLLDGNEIMIVNADTSEIVKDSTGADIKATSTSTGYTLSGLPAGRYIVIFKYDRNIYKITNYRQEGVNDTLSSKAIAGTATIGGNLEYVGMTDVIEITNSNINSINMGLIKLGNFDVSIEKSLSRIRTVNPKGKEQNYSYDKGTRIGKLEVAARNLVGTEVMVEYTIKISNLGESKAYISEIIDELPEDLEFDASSNSGWYEEGGKLRYTNLSEIEVGQTREIKLIATIKLTNDNLGIINNVATINATDGNNIQESNTQNNTSNAQLIIGTSTGRIVLNILGMVALLAIIGVGLFIIKKYR